MRENWTDRDVKYLMDNYHLFPNKELAEKLGRTKETIRTKASSLGIRKPDFWRNKYKLKILLNDSNISWYWLGFYITDGTICKNKGLRVVIQSRDSAHLKKLADYLNAPVNNFSLKHKGKIFDYCGVFVKDGFYAPKIKELFKITKQKTCNCVDSSFLERLTNDQFVSFLCGLLDGDGSTRFGKENRITVLRIRCHSSQGEFFEAIKSNLKDRLGIVSKCYINNQGYLTFVMYGQPQIGKLRDIVVSLNIPYLERKWFDQKIKSY